MSSRRLLLALGNLLCILLLVAGCSSDQQLSRANAESLIGAALREQDGPEITLYGGIPGDFWNKRCRLQGEMDLETFYFILSAWQSSGLIELSHVDEVFCSITDKGKSDVLVSSESPNNHRLRLGFLVLDGIDGMMQEKGAVRATVRFTFKVALTEAGKPLLRSRDLFVGNEITQLFRSRVDPKIRHGEATLLRFDSGWRVDAIRIESFN